MPMAFWRVVNRQARVSPQRPHRMGGKAGRVVNRQAYVSPQRQHRMGEKADRTINRCADTLNINQITLKELSTKKLKREIKTEKAWKQYF